MMQKQAIQFNLINQTMGVLPTFNLLAEDGKEYLSVSVSATEQPVSYRGKYYYRSGTALQDEIPEDGLREIICNAIVHKDCTGTFIQMRVWDDRVELWNIGTLPEGFTVETLMAEHDSRPRNMLIAKVFYLAGFIEAWGRGYEKIRKAFESEQLQFPSFEQVRGGMLATIPRERFVAINNGTS